MGNQQSAQPEDPVVKKKREQILEEILNTEKSYVNYLTIITDVYMEPMKAKALVKEDDVKTIFMNIEQILGFHSSFFRELALCYNSFNWTNEIKLSMPTTTKKTLSKSKANRKTTIVTTTTTTVLGEEGSKQEITSLESTREITEIFNNNSEDFKMYSFYIINYDAAVTTLQRLIKKKSGVASFLEKTRADPASNGLDLSSLLIMPVQRLPRYILLLGELLKLSPEKHPISKVLQNCVSIIKEVTAFINEAKRDDENSTKMNKIQEDLIDKVAILEKHRKLFFDSECQVHSIYPAKEEDNLLKRIRKARSATKQADKDKFTETFVFPEQNRVAQTMNLYLFNDCSLFLQKSTKTSFFNSNKIWSVASVSPLDRMRFIDVIDIFTLTNSLLVINDKCIFLIQMKNQDKEKFIKIFQMSKMDWGPRTSNIQDIPSAVSELPSVMTLKNLDPSSQTNALQTSTTTTTTSKSSFFGTTSTAKLDSSTAAVDHKRKQSVSAPKPPAKEPTPIKSKSMFFK